MTREELERLMMAHIDDEISTEDERRLLAHLETDQQARDEFEALRRLGEAQTAMTLKEPTELAWKQFEKGLVHKLFYRPLHTVGMLACVAGVMLVSGYGIYEWIRVVLPDDRLSPVFRIGAAAIITGILAMFVSVVIRRFVTLPSDRYHHEVER